MFNSPKWIGNAEIKNYLSAVSRGGAVSRFHTHRTIQQNTVGQHSHSVAMIVVMLLALAEDAKERYSTRDDLSEYRREQMVYAALVHDLAEHIVGDIPAPTKRLLKIRDLINDHEDSKLEEFGMKIVLTENEQAVVSAADALDGLMFCVTERDMGNKCLLEIASTYLSYLNDLVGVIPQHSMRLAVGAAMSTLTAALGRAVQ